MRPSIVFAQHTPGDAFAGNSWPDAEPSYRILPRSHAIACRIGLDGEREFESFLWWLVPFWSKSPEAAYKWATFNAKAEGIATKASFREAFKRRRCVIPANGFVESPTEGDRKQSYLVSLADERPLWFPGLWERWEGSGQEPIESVTIVTTEPNEFMKGIHHRMPVILEEREQLDLWLDHSSTSPEHMERVQGLLQPYSGRLRAVPVGDAIRSRKSANTAALIEATGPVQSG